MIHFNDIYGNQPDKFKEDDGRKLFLLYLRPIINGVGNYYIEAQTRNQRRTDVIVDYLGKQYIIELKIWHGDEYNSRGEQQIADYLLCFCFLPVSAVPCLCTIRAFCTVGSTAVTEFCPFRSSIAFAFSFHEFSPVSV